MTTTPDFRDLHVPGETQGDVVWFDGTHWSRVPAGTSGYVFQSAGPATIPLWAAPGGVIPGTANQVYITNGSLATAWSSTPAATAWVTAAANPSATGLLRGANASTLAAARNAANSADVTMLAIDSGNQVNVGDGVNSATLGLQTSNGNIRIKTQLLAGSTYPVFMWDLTGTSAQGFGIAQGSGTNQPGNSLVLFAGLPTGSGIGGSVSLLVSQNQGSSGSTVNTHNVALVVAQGSVAGKSFIGINKAAPAIELDVVGAIAATTTITATNTLASTGNVTAGTTIDAVGAITGASFGGHSGGNFALADVSLSAAGTGTLTLSSAQMACGSIRLTGVLTGNRAVQVPLLAGARATVYNGTTGAAFYATFGSSSGNVVWLPRNQWTTVVCDGTNWLAETWGQPTQLSYPGLSLVIGTGTVNTQIDTVPLLAPYKAIRVTKAEVICTTTIVGGITRLGLGIASGGTTLLASAIFDIAAAGTNKGLAVVDLGTDMAAANGYEARYTAAMPLWFQDAQSSLACIAGVAAANVCVYLEGGG